MKTPGELLIKVDFDYSHPESYHNFIERLSLACADKSKIGMLGSVLFTGWAISSLFVNRLADILGRKKVFLTSMALQAPAMLIIILSQNYYLTAFAFFIMGLCAAGRVSVGFLLMVEIMPTERARFVQTAGMILDCFGALVAIGYFYFVS